MTRPLVIAAAVCALVLVAGIAVFAYLMSTGLHAKPQPGAIETFVAHRVRNAVIGFRSRHLKNPVPLDDTAVADGRAHFADHCAGCHGNDGRGDTEMGRGLYPKAPDMRLSSTQDLTDGQLFYIIENGIRLTGMPAWGTGSPAGEEASWRLVHFIRHMPRITDEEIQEMEALNPKSPDEIRQQIEEQHFLEGGDSMPTAPMAHHH